MTTIRYWSDKDTLAQFVDDLTTNSRLSWQSITVTKPEKSEEFCVSIVTDMSSEDIDASIQDYCNLLWTTSMDRIPDGSFLPR